ncbi:hypothetical protein WR25_20202 isoform A [Diploscapter pachys]|uniref:UBC core domain-containing protein n=1 Tax=Diploscapter pachys TaxID=2018661 RepID=A0A2A2JTK1_9BILA|nr:hypothetical protein WR25_20202 isoform A [Diploscapter pachys]
MVPTAFKSNAAEQEGYEFAEEARQAEPLKLNESLIVSHTISSEFARLCRQPIDGIYITSSASNLFEWFGIIFIRRGVFGGGIFRFNLLIPRKYPLTSELPTVKFHIQIFHPHIDKEKKLDLSRYFPEGWKSEKHHLHNVLLVTQRIFFSYDCDPSSCANPEAALLWKEQPDQFKQMAKEAVNLSRSQVYDEPPDDDDNAIRLTPWDTSMHGSVREKMKSFGSRNDSDKRYVALSWIDTDAMTYMNEAIKLDDEMRAEHARLVHGIERLDLSGIQGEDEPEEKLNVQNSAKEEDSLRTDISLSSAESLSSGALSRHQKLERPDGILREEETNSPDDQSRLQLEINGEESDV